ncbi:MAG: M4 family metallopeptidase, partial [Synergistaceae bacterium]|nr:M4 family metallopeptidase [Synergistaceae bacterium]
MRPESPAFRYGEYVKRPSGQDSQVILTANAGDLSRVFALRVIHSRTRDINDVIDSDPLPPDAIEIMNQDNDEFNIVYDEEQIRHIDGQFSELKVENADDALDAVQGLSESLGIDDPYSELTLMKTFRDEYGAQYSFKQVHEMDGSTEKLEVYGRTVMVSANTSGDTDFLSSTFIASEKLDSANGLYTRNTQAQAEEAALDSYEDSSGLEVISTKRVIYSLGRDYEAAPVIAFIVRVAGYITQDGGEIPVNDDVIVNGITLEIIETSSNLRTYIVNNSATDELGERKTFPVDRNLFTGSRTLRDNGSPEVIVYLDNDLDNPVRISKKASWTDRHQISAYTNMRTVLKWWKDTFNRNSIDGEGMTVKLKTHRTGYSDNACFSQGDYSISVGDIYDSAKFDLTRAIGLDTLTHETGHAVLYFTTGGISYNNATGAIDDGYADIFGCLRDKDWRHGWRADDDNDPDTGITYFKDKTQCLRDAREDISVESLSKNAGFGLTSIKTLDELYEHYATVPGIQSGSGYNDGNGCHTYCRLITHAAYLMHKDGVSNLEKGRYYDALTWEELGKVWYKSLSMGLDNNSNFHTVRRNVIRAAQQMKLNSYKIFTIKKAFDKIEVTNPSGTLKGTVENWDDGSTISGGATVSITGSTGIVEKTVKTNSDGSFTIDAEAGNYSLSIYATYASNQYRTYRTRVYIPANKTVSVNAELVKTGTGTLDVYLSDENGKALSGATVTAMRDENRTTFNPTSTQASNGKYTFSNLQ